MRRIASRASLSGRNQSVQELAGDIFNHRCVWLLTVICSYSVCMCVCVYVGYFKSHVRMRMYVCMYVTCRGTAVTTTLAYYYTPIPLHHHPPLYTSIPLYPHTTTLYHYTPIPLHSHPYTSIQYCHAHTQQRKAQTQHVDAQHEG
jgi:hypothetical protein